MARRMVFVDGVPACPKCGSTSYRNKRLLEWGRAQITCVGCGIGLLPAAGRKARAAKKEAFRKPAKPAPEFDSTADHQHVWRDQTSADDRRNGVRFSTCAQCGKGKTVSA